jgi:pre-mRNA branch site protein p14
MYDIFGKYGALRQIRLGNAKDTKGKAFVVYEDIFDAKNACDHMTGFYVGGRYITVLYYQISKQANVDNRTAKKEEIEKLKTKYGVDGEDHEKKSKAK